MPSFHFSFFLQADEHDSKMPNPCSSSNGDTSSVSHTCDLCDNRNHTFCGVPVEENHGGHVHCQQCPVSVSTPGLTHDTTSPELSQRVLTEFVGKAARSERFGTVLDFTATADCEGKEKDSNEESLDSDDPVESTDDGYNTNESTITTSRCRAPPTVTLLTVKARVVQYMQTLYGEGKTRLPSTAVAHFPRSFTGNQKANLQKASRWWNARKAYHQEGRESADRGKKTHASKASSGRGRKRAPSLLRTSG
ncbi:hypothetical protein JG687_00016980 [Phytophthora cactorum]|uniref:Uncharacterized protein n=1 Tax=Phytophthora cactorum TaxID=29920 RepID=A0A8T1TT43_9STRA|nr:hypothetical protein JG687_00016980 [Phytophthora cactorum]